VADEGLVEHLEMLQKKQDVVSLDDAFRVSWKLAVTGGLGPLLQRHLFRVELDVSTFHRCRSLQEL
jgi:hypothetical protein